MSCLSLAYVADKVPPSRRAAAFGVFSGVCVAGFVAGTVAARFLTVPSTFQVAAVSAVAAAVYMRAFVQETDGGASLLRAAGDEEENSHPLCVPSCSSSSEDVAPPTLPPLRKAASLSEMAALLTTSSTFSRAALVTFFHTLGETGLQTALLYYLKAQFHYTKNQYANLLLVIGIAGSLSQLVIMPMLAPKLGEQKLLIIALLGSCMHCVLYSIAWSPWVPYLGASFFIIGMSVNPCIRSIVSKRAGPFEQGMAQGCLTGISSTANVISPIVFTPLTAWFLSETAPFNFKGFSLACAGFAMLIALAVSINMRPAELQPDSK
ncbi:uncharacterized protein LOC102716320 isoform X3 [Oryza brachyantha]|uniref:Major facilitator superfamily (MFS) profile domain-containing protein n=2 Tax=Oryza brachyantha TaxID=4533 RepID=J3M5V7_ORYBR|nr:uncharacterized protein LOC102716320 isoform X3 [Oryza brachyantha]